MEDDKKPGLAGTCTWALQLMNGAYVLNLETKATGFSRDDAFVWFSEQRALEVAKATEWIGAGARAARARP